MNHAALRGAGPEAPAATSLSRRHFALSLGAALGTAVARPAGAAAPEPAAGTAVIDLSSNENPYGPSAAALEAMTRSQAVAGRYPDAAEQETIEAIARLHGVGPDRIVLGCGSSEVLRLCDAAFLGPGRTVVAAEPTFEAVLHYAKVTKAEAVKVPLTADFRHDLPAMARACDTRAGLVYVCNPNNPTGTIVTGDELLTFLAQVPPAHHPVRDELRHDRRGRGRQAVPRGLRVAGDPGGPALRRHAHLAPGDDRHPRGDARVPGRAPRDRPRPRRRDVRRSAGVQTSASSARPRRTRSIPAGSLGPRP